MMLISNIMVKILVTLAMGHCRDEKHTGNPVSFFPFFFEAAKILYTGKESFYDMEKTPQPPKILRVAKCMVSRLVVDYLYQYSDQCRVHSSKS